MIELPKGTLLPYFTAGWPTGDAFVEAVCGAAEAGCPAFEVGIPFSDPVADGPVIQQTSSQALANGVTWSTALRLIRRATQESGLPAIAMTYCNPLHAQGLEKAMSELFAAGVRGVIVPDLTMEEGETYQEAAMAAGIDLIYLAAPTTPPARLAELAKRTRCFLYLVAVRGVTGARQALPPDFEAAARRASELSPVPVLAGFGVSTPAQAAQVGAVCHGAIVGSALLQALSEAPASEARATTREFLGAMREAMAKV